MVGVEFQFVGAALLMRHAFAADGHHSVVAHGARPEVGVCVVAPGLADVAEDAALDVGCWVRLELLHDEDVAGAGVLAALSGAVAVHADEDVALRAAAAEGVVDAGVAVDAGLVGGVGEGGP